MKNLTLESENLNVNVALIGAELTRIFDKKDGTEHLWNGNPAYWPRQAPNLFPTIGESKDGVVTIKGKKYPMGRHGFARFEEFSVVLQQKNRVVLELKSNERTKTHYPYDFEFRVSYTVEGNRIDQSFEVFNSGSEELGFQVGGHPAFTVPFDNGERYDEYEIWFDSPQTLDRHLLTKEGIYSGDTRRFLDDEKSFALFYELFKEDALVFKDIPSKRVWIQHRSGGKRLQVDYEGFPHLGIWSIPGADYVCIEPWIGCADSVNSAEDFYQKDNVVRLAPGRKFNASFSISVVQ